MWSGGGRTEGVSRPRSGDAVVGERGRCLSRRTGSTPSAWMRTYGGGNEEASSGRENEREGSSCRRAGLAGDEWERKDGSKLYDSRPKKT
jgi:hypothetical protein